jgi:hypothetical protein
VQYAASSDQNTVFWHGPGREAPVSQCARIDLRTRNRAVILGEERRREQSVPGNLIE